MFNSDLPSKFLILRKYLEYSQENIAHEIGISSEAYGKIERGKTRISEQRIRQIAKILGFEPWELLQMNADELLLELMKRKAASD